MSGSARKGTGYALPYRQTGVPVSSSSDRSGNQYLSRSSPQSQTSQHDSSSSKRWRGSMPSISKKSGYPELSMHRSLSPPPCLYESKSGCQCSALSSAVESGSSSQPKTSQHSPWEA